MGRFFRWWRMLRPPRTIRPTKEGWWFLFATLGLGSAATNPGNNLLSLLLSMLLGTIVVSGILSEQCLKRLRLYRAAPREIFAGTPAAVGCLLYNSKRLLASYSLIVELPAPTGGALRRFFAPKLDAGQQRLCSWEETFPRRGRHQLPAARVMTRFPFGLFLKATHPITLDEVLVFPAVRPLAPEDARDLGGSGGEREPRPGRGPDLPARAAARPGGGGGSGGVGRRAGAAPGPRHGPLQPPRISLGGRSPPDPLEEHGQIRRGDGARARSRGGGGGAVGVGGSSGRRGPRPAGGGH